MSLPKRRVQLVVEEMGEETLVYCGDAKKAFCLNPICARVFGLCDGTRSTQEMAKQLDVAEGLVINSLAILQEHNLLDPLQTVTRRDLIKGAALLIPAVLAVNAPEPSMAASAAGGCINNTACGANGNFVRTCQPCDALNAGLCASPISFCMSTWEVNVGPTQDPIPGETCANDIYRGPAGGGGFVNQCENANASNIWAQDCNAARAAVIAARPPKPQQISFYKCCSCAGR